LREINGRGSAGRLSTSGKGIFAGFRNGQAIFAEEDTFDIDLRREQIGIFRRDESCPQAGQSSSGAEHP